MKVVLILSLALVLLASVSFAARSMVILPAYAPEDITHEKRETVVEGVEQEPDRAANPFRAVEVDDGGQPKVVPLVSAFGLKKADLQELYQQWLPKVPEGEDSSFPAFLDWLKEQDETEEQEESEEQEEPENTDESDQEDGDKRSSDTKEYVVDQQPLAKFQRSVDEEQPEINLQEVAKDFGLTEAELEDLYRIWVPKVPAGEDASFEAFINWMGKNNEPEDDDAAIVETRSWNKFAKWGSKIGNWFRIKYKKEYLAGEQQLAEDQRSIDEEQPEINQQEVATITEDKRSLVDWFKKTGKAFTEKNPRELEEDQQQNIVNGQESMAERDLQASVKPGPKSASNEDEENDEEQSQGEIAKNFGLTEAQLEELYQLWVPKVPTREDSSFEAFINWMDENDEPEDDGDVDVGSRSWNKYAKFGSGGNYFGKKTKREYVADEQQLAEFQRSVDEEQPEINQQEVATGTRSWNKYAKFGSGGNYFGKKTKREYVADEQQLSEDQRSVDEEQPEINQQEVATVTEDKISLASWFNTLEKAFKKKKSRGLEEDQQQNIANGQGSMAERDLQPSFKPGPKSAWSEDEDDDEEESRDEIAEVTEDKRDLVGWFKKIGKAFTQKNPRELEEDQQQNIVNGQESMAERDLQASVKPGPKSATFVGEDLFEAYRKWIQTVGKGEDKSFEKFAKLFNIRKSRSLENELSDESQITVTEDKRDLVGWFKKIGKAFTQKNPRELEEDQQQSIVNGQGSMAERDLQSSSKPGPKSATFVGQDLFEAYRKWIQTVGKGKDKSFQTFAKLFNIRKSRSFEDEPSDESQITDAEKREGEEKEKEDPVKEKEPEKEKESGDVSGGYSCEKNSPCNIENIANEQFYFATELAEKFIQCDAWGGCHTLTCEDGLIWDDQIKTCGIRT